MARDTTPETHEDPQTHLDTDPVNAEPAPEAEEAAPGPTRGR